MAILSLTHKTVLSYTSSTKKQYLIRQNHKPSILQDLELGRPMEIDGIFDAFLGLARMADVTTPTQDLVVALMKVRARGAGLHTG